MHATDGIVGAPSPVMHTDNWVNELGTTDTIKAKLHIYPALLPKAMSQTVFSSPITGATQPLLQHQYMRICC